MNNKDFHLQHGLIYMMPLKSLFKNEIKMSEYNKKNRFTDIENKSVVTNERGKGGGAR